MNDKKILIIEDDKAVRSLIETTLEVNHYIYESAENGKEGISKIISFNPSVVILDLGLPDIDGIEVINKVRGWSNVAIIIVSARNEDYDKIKALDAGADDYLTKPFSIDELLARIRVNLRRMKYVDVKEKEKVFVNKNLKVDYITGCVYVNDEEIHLTPIEHKLITLLAQNAGRVLTHSYILKNVWGEVMQSEIPSLRVFMTNLRKKIEKKDKETKYIQTHVGIGYRMLRYDD